MPAPSTLTAWFAAMLDQKLAAQPDNAARIRFLAHQSGVYQLRRQMFIQTDGRSERPHPTFGMPTATDFLLMIGEIDQRHHDLLRAVPA